MGFKIMATAGTAAYLRARGIPAKRVLKVHEGRPNCLDLIVNGDVQLLINTPLGKHAQRDDYLLRQAAIVHRVSYTTTMSAASAACDAILVAALARAERAVASGMAGASSRDARGDVDARRAQ